MFADFDAISVGDTRSLVRTISMEDVLRFVELTGDDNPLHVDRAFAEDTSFKDIVVHGMLGASFLSTVIGTKLPGPGALWISQNIEFLLPVRLGDELTVTCKVIRKHERDRLLELDTKIVNQNGQTVLAGVGKVKVLAAKIPAQIATRDESCRTAIVTGGSGGIGSAICRRLASEGLNVVVNYHGQRDKAEGLVTNICNDGFKAIAVKADVASQEGAEALVREATRAFGPINVLVNNASPRINPKPFAVSEWDDFEKHLAVQLKGAYLMGKICLPSMIEGKWGRIINITSQATEGQPTIGWTAYATAKAALAAMSRNLAVEVGPQGVTVNCISPGMTDTSLIGDIPEKLQMMIARQTPLRRLASPDDVAAAAAYLVSNDAGFITGHTLRVNGGMVMQ